MAKDTKMMCMIEAPLKDRFSELALKKGQSASALLRSLVIDELRMQGLLPEEYAVALFKGLSV